MTNQDISKMNIQSMAIQPETRTKIYSVLNQCMVRVSPYIIGSLMAYIFCRPK